MGRGTGAVMGLPKALTGSIVMDRDSANGVLTFAEVQKKKSSLHWSTTGMFYSSHSPYLRRQGGRVCAGVGAVFKCVRSPWRARTSLKLLHFRQTSADTCTESHVGEEATHEKHFQMVGPRQKGHWEKLAELLVLSQSHFYLLLVFPQWSVE